MINLINGDSLEVLATFPENSIDSIVTDPPYELGYIGKKWDHTGIAHNVELWRECLRVLKPGGHLLAFGGSRTYHRMASAIEDAGFEVRDQMMWLYGSGFPKGYNIAKGIDKKLGAVREVIGTKQAVDFSHHKGSMMVKETAPDNKRQRTLIELTAPATAEAKQWEGWHTALKPAHEPVCVARKPIAERNVVDNVLQWGTGGMNIDGCRFPVVGGKTTAPGDRWPSNIIFDEEAAILLDNQSGTKASRFFYCPKPSQKERGDSNNHPTVKPLKLISHLVKLVTPSGGTCLDPFMGSGTTGLACRELGFGFIGIEMDGKYFEIAQGRIDGYRNDEGVA